MPPQNELVIQQLGNLTDTDTSLVIVARDGRGDVFDGTNESELCAWWALQCAKLAGRHGYWVMVFRYHRRTGQRTELASCLLRHGDPPWRFPADKTREAFTHVADTGEAIPPQPNVEFVDWRPYSRFQRAFTRHRITCCAVATWPAVVVT